MREGERRSTCSGCLHAVSRQMDPGARVRKASGAVEVEFVGKDEFPRRDEKARVRRHLHRRSVLVVGVGIEIDEADVAGLARRFVCRRTTMELLKIWRDRKPHRVRPDHLGRRDDAVVIPFVS